MPAITPVSPVSRVPSALPGSVLGKQELYTLYSRDGSSESYYAESGAAAILIAKRKLGLDATASEQCFCAAGGNYVLRNATGNRIYPTVRH